MNLSTLLTEARNPLTEHIDQLPTLDMLRLIGDEDRKAVAAVAAVLPQIAKAVDAIEHRFEDGGRLFYIGAGTSGRLGVLDASEIPPTFSVPPTLVQGIIAGGDSASANPASPPKTPPNKAQTISPPRASPVRTHSSASPPAAAPPTSSEPSPTQPNSERSPSPSHASPNPPSSESPTLPSPPSPAPKPSPAAHASKPAPPRNWSSTCSPPES